MEPFLKENDLIIVSNIPYLFKKPRINDIVAFRTKENIILIKRIKRIINNRYLLLGDNSSDSFDSRSFGEIEKESILGKFIYKL